MIKNVKIPEPFQHNKYDVARDTYIFVAFSTWAIHLINEHRVADVLKNDILKMHIRDHTRVRSRPCFDSNTIISANKTAILDKHTNHWLFTRISTKATNTNAMTRSTSDFSDVKLLCFIADGDAIISSGERGVCDVHSARSRDVDAICVGATAWSTHLEVEEC